MRKELSRLTHALTGSVLAAAGLLAHAIEGDGAFSFLQILFLGVGAILLAPVVFRGLASSARSIDRFTDRHLIEHPGKRESERAESADRSS